MHSLISLKVTAICIMLLALSACGGSTTDTGLNASDIDSIVDTQDDTLTSSKNGVVTLNWLPPVENSDGSSLEDLSSYNIYYGLTPDMLNNSISLSNPGLSTYVIENLESNTTYYFAVTAKNSQNAESELSNIISKVTSS